METCKMKWKKVSDKYMLSRWSVLPDNKMPKKKKRKQAMMEIDLKLQTCMKRDKNGQHKMYASL